MATTQASALLEAVQRMDADEFDAFLERALSLRRGPSRATLSAKETSLIKRINRGLSAELRQRYARLCQRRRQRRLTSEEHAELLQLTHVAESQDADRAAALDELAKLRGVPLRTLMKQMGIRPAAKDATITSTTE